MQKWIQAGKQKFTHAIFFYNEKMNQHDWNCLHNSARYSK